MGPQNGVGGAPPSSVLIIRRMGDAMLTNVLFAHQPRLEALLGGFADFYFTAPLRLEDLRGGNATSGVRVQD